MFLPATSLKCVDVSYFACGLCGYFACGLCSYFACGLCGYFSCGLCGYFACGLVDFWIVLCADLCLWTVRMFCLWTVRIFCLWTVRIFGTLLAPLGAGASSEVSFGEAKWFEGPTNTQNSQASEFEIRMTQTKNRDSNRKVIRSENYITVVRFYMAMCHHKLAFQI